MLDISLLMEQITQILRDAGKLLLQDTVVVNCHKTANDLLTENDLRTEQYIIDAIRTVFPRVNILSEEHHPDAPLEGITVVIDPIDGTCNYAAGMDLYGIQVAVFADQVCVGSVLYFPVGDELITAQLGKGAYLNGRRLTTDPEKAATDGMLLISDYYPDQPVSMDDQFALVKALQPHFLKTRHFGAACVDFAMLVKGHALAYITYYHKIWDIAPGLLAAKEAGFVHGWLCGDQYSYGAPGLVVANSEQTLALILKNNPQ